MEKLEARGLDITDPCPVCHQPVGEHQHAPPTGGAGASPGSSDSSFANKLSKISRDLPKWSTSSVCRTFLDKISLIMPTSGIPQAEWNKVFPHQHNKHETTTKRNQANIIDKNLDWKQSCDAFTAHFQLSDHRETLKVEYRVCKQSKGETGQA